MQEKVLGKTHPDTLDTIMNVAIVHTKTKDFTNAEEMYKRALDGHEQSLGKEHESTKRCARNMARLYRESEINDEEKMRFLVARHPHLVQGDDARALSIRPFIA